MNFHFQEKTVIPNDLMHNFKSIKGTKTSQTLAQLNTYTVLKLSPPRGEGVLRFAVIRGRADFQGRLFDPKYFRQGANLSFN